MEKLLNSDFLLFIDEFLRGKICSFFLFFRLVFFTSIWVGRCCYRVYGFLRVLVLGSEFCYKGLFFRFSSRGGFWYLKNCYKWSRRGSEIYFGRRSL